MAWYKSSKEASKKFGLPKKATSVMTGGLSDIKQVGQAWSSAVKQPTYAISNSISSGSAQPMKEYAGDMWSQGVKQPLNKLGAAVGITDKDKEGPSSIGGNVPDYSKFSLNLTSSAPTSNQAMTGDQIGQQYSNLQSLAKMREGAAAQGEQLAIQRRLASSGMGGSGAGMRMQQKAGDMSSRRLAEHQLGLGAEEAQARQRQGEAAAGRDFQERQFEYQKQKDQAEFETNKEVIAENQRIARATQRYNERGLFGQLFSDLFGGG